MIVVTIAPLFPEPNQMRFDSKSKRKNVNKMTFFWVWQESEIPPPLCGCP